jgi:hypothetical protein
MEKSITAYSERKTSIMTELRPIRHDHEFSQKRSWPPNLRFEDDPKQAASRSQLTYLKRYVSYADTASVSGNAMTMCVESPLAGIE